MDERVRPGDRRRLPGGVAGRAEITAAAHALLLGDDRWERLFDSEPDEVVFLTRQAVYQRAAELDADRQRNQAVRIANAMNGARSIDGSSGANTSSTRG